MVWYTHRHPGRITQLRRQRRLTHFEGCGTEWQQLLRGKNSSYWLVLAERTSRTWKQAPTPFRERLPAPELNAWEVQNPTFSGSACTAQLVGYKRVSGVVTLLSSGSVPCHSMMEVRIVRTSYNQLCVYFDGIAWAAMNESSITSGKPGVGVRGQTSAQGEHLSGQLGANRHYAAERGQRAIGIA